MFWDQIHKLGPNSKKMQKVPNIVRINAHLTSDKDQVKQKWFSDFAMLYTGPSVGLNHCSVGNIFYEDILHRIRAREYFMECDGYVENEFLNVDISFDEILKIVKALKLKKSVGFDKVPNECLNYYNITLFMYNFFKLCFDNSVVPVDWTKAIIAPVPKQVKDPYEPLSYRGISLLSCIGKVYSALIESRIVKYCDMLGLIADEQNGFRRGCSCSEHIFLATSIICNRLTEGKDTFIAFVDMEKAFDWIRRPLLYYLLLECNIDGKIYKAIKALYTNNTAQLRINASLETDWFQVPSGVRQGDPLSATLFNIFINGLVENIKLLNIGININGKLISILLYADDIILLAKSEPELQRILV